MLYCRQTLNKSQLTQGIHERFLKKFITTLINDDVTTLNDEKHLNESCHKISEQWHASK